MPSKTRQTAGSVAAVLVLLGGAAAGCGADAEEGSDDSAGSGPSDTGGTGSGSGSEEEAALPTPSPLKGQYSACDLLLPAEVGHYLEIDPPTPLEEEIPNISITAPGTEAEDGSLCTYDGQTGPALIAELSPVVTAAQNQLELAMAGTGPADTLRVHGQPAAMSSDTYGVTTLGMIVANQNAVLKLAVSGYADGTVPGTDELAVPGDERVAAAQKEAAEALAEIALVRMGAISGG